MMRKRKSTLIGIAAAGSAAAAYFLLLRPRHLRWGATDEEISLPLPGGEHVDGVNYATTRAIEIDATPREIWPWLAQMGEQPRGGFYSFVTVERLLGMRVENATAIDPEIGKLEVGQRLDRNGNLLVKAFELEKYLVLGPPDTDDLVVRWSLELSPVGETKTRLVSRVRARMRTSPASVGWRILLDPGQLVMERRMLQQIKRRAEARPAEAIDAGVPAPVSVA